MRRSSSWSQSQGFISSVLSNEFRITLPARSQQVSNSQATHINLEGSAHKEQWISIGVNNYWTAGACGASGRNQNAEHTVCSLVSPGISDQRFSEDLVEITCQVARKIHDRNAIPGLPFLKLSREIQEFAYHFYWFNQLPISRMR
jgi:hypothetical protein